MHFVALKMLMGDRAKYLGIIIGLTFASLLITQQGAIFVGLMALSFLSAFVIPQSYGDRVRNVQGLFAPVARPLGALGAWVRGKGSADRVAEAGRQCRGSLASRCAQ